ncbi:MAG: hypothetical protein CMP41_03825 [Rickettsiales bacterium]|nr:hypothetical protein [Rickettsiales bacterium]
MKTKLLISVKDILEIKKIIKYTDIVDLKMPDLGPLGSWNKKNIVKVIDKYKFKKILSATLGNIITNEKIISNLLEFDNLGLDYIKIGLFNKKIEDINKLFLLLKKLNLKTNLVGVFFAENKNLLDFFIKNSFKLKESRFKIILMDTLNKQSGGLLDIFSVSELDYFVQNIKKNNLKVGLAGKIQSFQIKTLLSLSPHLIGLRSAVCDRNNRNLDISEDLVQKVSDQFKSDTINAHEVAGA